MTEEIKEKLYLNKLVFILFGGQVEVLITSLIDESTEEVVNVYKPGFSSSEFMSGSISSYSPYQVPEVTFESTHIVLISSQLPVNIMKKLNKLCDGVEHLFAINKHSKKLYRSMMKDKRQKSININPNLTLEELHYFLLPFSLLEMNRDETTHNIIVLSLSSLWCYETFGMKDYRVVGNDDHHPYVDSTITPYKPVTYYLFPVGSSLDRLGKASINDHYFTFLELLYLSCYINPEILKKFKDENKCTYVEKGNRTDFEMFVRDASLINFVIISRKYSDLISSGLTVQAISLENSTNIFLSIFPERFVVSGVKIEKLYPLEKLPDFYPGLIDKVKNHDNYGEMCPPVHTETGNYHMK